MTTNDFEETVMKTMNFFLAQLFPMALDLKSLEEVEYAKEDDPLYATFVSFVGDVEGALLIKIAESSVKKFIGNIPMYSKESNDNKDEIIKGTFGELANILVGNLIPLLKNNPSQKNRSFNTIFDIWFFQ